MYLYEFVFVSFQFQNHLVIIKISASVLLLQIYPVGTDIRYKLQLERAKIQRKIVRLLWLLLARMQTLHYLHAQVSYTVKAFIWYKMEQGDEGINEHIVVCPA